MIVTNLLSATALATYVAAAGDSGPPVQVINALAENSNSINNRVTQLTSEFASHDKPTASSIQQYANGIQQQVSACIDTANKQDVAGPVLRVMIAPTVNSIIGGVQQLTSAAAENPEGSSSVQPLSTKLAELANTCEKNGIKEEATQLRSLSHQVGTLGAGGQKLQARDASLWGAVIGGLTNAGQRVQSFANDLTRPGARPGALAMTNIIAGIDGQIDNILGLITEVLRPLTLGASDLVMGFILGPTFQSITDGIEVLIGNALGGVLDIALVPTTRALQSSVKQMATVARQFRMEKYAAKFDQQSMRLSGALAHSNAHANSNVSPASHNANHPRRGGL